MLHNVCLLVVGVVRVLVGRQARSPTSTGTEPAFKLGQHARLKIYRRDLCPVRGIIITLRTVW